MHCLFRPRAGGLRLQLLMLHSPVERHSAHLLAHLLQVAQRQHAYMTHLLLRHGVTLHAADLSLTCAAEFTVLTISAALAYLG